MQNSKTAPEGRFMATVKVGEKGQIVIPKGARDLFAIKPGDTLLLLADKAQGIAIVRNDLFMHFANEVLRLQGKLEGGKVNDSDSDNQSD